MSTSIIFGLALGLDSLQVSFGLGLLKPSIRRRIVLGVVFGLCDGLAVLAGLGVGHALRDVISMWVHYLGPVALALYAFSLLTLRRKEEGDDWNARWGMVGLPFCLSLDNLVAGVGLGMLDHSVLLSSLVIGLLSGLLALVGLWSGEFVGNRLPLRKDLVGGIAMLVLSVKLALEQ